MTAVARTAIEEGATSVAAAARKAGSLVRHAGKAPAKTPVKTNTRTRKR
jgi:hypothetical protein